MHINSAYAFVKPHAVNDAVVSRITATLADHRVSVVAQGRISAQTIGEKGIIDKHYGQLAERAMSLAPAELPAIAEAKKAAFEEMAGFSWEAGLASGIVCNLSGALSQLGDISMLEVSTPLPAQAESTIHGVRLAAGAALEGPRRSQTFSGHLRGQGGARRRACPVCCQRLLRCTQPSSATTVWFDAPLCGCRIDEG